MNQSGLKSYRLDPEELEKLLESQYGSSILPVNHAKLKRLKFEQARSAAFVASFKNENVVTDTPELENKDQETIE